MIDLLAAKLLSNNQEMNDASIENCSAEVGGAAISYNRTGGRALSLFCQLFLGDRKATESPFCHHEHEESWLWTMLAFMILLFPLCLKVLAIFSWLG